MQNVVYAARKGAKQNFAFVLYKRFFAVSPSRLMVSTPTIFRLFIYLIDVNTFFSFMSTTAELKLISQLYSTDEHFS